MSKKKIAIFGVKYFPSRGGTSRVVENLLSELKEEFDFTVYCYRHNKAAQFMKAVDVVEFKEIPIKGIGVFIYYFRCCIHLLLKGNFDLIHVHKTDGAFFLPLLSLKYKLVATSHALPYLNDKWSGIGKWYFKMVERIFMRSKAYITTISKAQAVYYTQKYNRPIHFIPNGILAVAKINSGSVSTLLKEHQIQDNYLLFAARRIIPLKGCHHLLAALKQMNYKGTLVVAGDPDQLPEYTQSLKNMAEGLDVKFIGYVAGMDKLNALISKALYFVFPSEIEGMSMMLLETGCLGTPMICSNIAPNKAVLSEQEVLFFESQNVADLQAKLEWALAHPAQMKSRAQKTKQTVEAAYLIGGVARQYAQLYKDLLNPKSEKQLVNQL